MRKMRGKKRTFEVAQTPVGTRKMRAEERLLPIHIKGCRFLHIPSFFFFFFWFHQLSISLSAFTFTEWVVAVELHAMCSIPHVASLAAMSPSSSSSSTQPPTTPGPTLHTGNYYTVQLANIYKGLPWKGGFPIVLGLNLSKPHWLFFLH